MKAIIKGENFKDYIKKPKEKPRILLIDEVDVFFGEEFYGKTYDPVVKI